MKIKKFNRIITAVLLVLSFSALQSAHASLILMTNATVESGTPWNLGGGVGELIDGDTTAGPNWFGFRPLSGLQNDRVRLTLGGIYDLSAVNIWNNGGGIDNDREGLKDFQLTFLDANFLSLGSYSGSLLDLQTIQTQTISAFGVAFVDLTFKTSHGVNYAIITEIQLEGEATVPEPSTLAVLALGMMGLASRRFKRKQ
jgi:hypothetical protein